MGSPDTAGPPAVAKFAGRKRVRFSDDVIYSQKPASRTFKATVLSAVDDEEDELGAELQAGGRSLHGAEATLDPGAEDLSIPEVAAALRAQHRKELEGMRSQGSIHDEVAAAEAAYDEPDELFTDDGIPIEPFHLKREREDGYFDADGNYIEYANVDEDDAWLASLAESIDGELLREVPTSNPEPAKVEEDVEQDSQMKACKARLVELLQPGETVLDALRRLAVHNGADESQESRDLASAAPEVREADKPTGGRERQKLRPKQTIPEQHREAFDALTDCSTRLLDGGDYNAHSNTREQLVSDLQAREDLDMFDVEDKPVQGPQVSPDSQDAVQPTQQASAQPAGADSSLEQQAHEKQAQAKRTRTATQPSNSLLMGGSSSAPAAEPGQSGPGPQASPSRGAEQREEASATVGNVHFDQRTGMYYVPDMGCYWDGGQLYGDASSGQWYAFRDGQYQLVS